MKQIFLIFVACLTLPIAARAQIENPLCPKISVVGPASVIMAERGEPMTFRATVENLPENLKIEYLWTITAGKIISGQGTPVIEVEVKDLGNENVTANLEIKGLLENCAKTALETGPVSRIIDNCLGGYGKVSRFTESVYLDNEIIQLHRNPNLSIVFHLKFKGKPTSKQIDLRIARIVRQFAFRKALKNLDRTAFVIVDDEDSEYTTICYLQVGSETDYCDECKVIKGANLILSKFLKSKKAKK